MLRRSTAILAVSRTSVPLVNMDRLVPSPSPVPVMEPCFLRIRPDICDSTLQFLVITNDVVIVFRLPDLPTTVDLFVDEFCTERFPRVYNFWKAVPDHWFHDDVNMIWHDAPRQQFVSLSVEKPQ